MADSLPYTLAPGTITKIVEKLKAAQTPVRFTQDFLGTALNCPGGSAMAFIPLAKRMGLLASDGTPTDLYKRLRNPTQSKGAMAEAIKRAYAELFRRDEYADRLPREKLEGLVIEATGQAKGSRMVRAILGTFEALKAFADFEAPAAPAAPGTTDEVNVSPPLSAGPPAPAKGTASPPPFNLSYTIYLNLPKTDDIAVFNAIFRSLRENLLRP